MTRNLKNDVCTITGASNESVDKVVTLCEDVICHCVFESISDKEQLTQIDIGIGELYIRRDGDLIKYKFIPNNEFDDKVRGTYKNGVSPLVIKANKSLKLKFDRAYKELI